MALGREEERDLLASPGGRTLMPKDLPGPFEKGILVCSRVSPAVVCTSFGEA